jgi:hypothetical protein
VLCKVYRVCRAGAQQPSEAIRRDRHVGDLLYKVRLYHPEARHQFMKAVLLGSDGETYLLPVIDEAQIEIRPTGILIAGKELIPRGRGVKNIKCDVYPQSWWCVPIRPEDQPRGDPSPAAARAEARRRGEIVGDSMTNHYSQRGRS